MDWQKVFLAPIYIRHSGESRNSCGYNPWTPAFAGVTVGEISLAFSIALYEYIPMTYVFENKDKSKNSQTPANEPKHTKKYHIKQYVIPPSNLYFPLPARRVIIAWNRISP
jgi:hypothetical protein